MAIGIFAPRFDQSKLRLASSSSSDNHTQNSNPRKHPRQTSRSQAQPRITATLTQPPPRASALASGTIACASSRCSTDPSARCGPSLHLPLPPNLVKQEAVEARELRLTVSRCRAISCKLR